MQDAEQERLQKKVCVVVDTNAWRSSFLLRSASGVALLFYLKRTGGFLGLPEVLEEEWIRHAENELLALVKKLTPMCDKLETMLGKRIHWGMPTEAEIKEVANNRFKELEPFYKRVAFTFEHARLALDRVNSKLPPNGEENQQFKDSAIWEAVLELARSFSIYFISVDGDFCGPSSEKRDQLAVNLANECASLGADIRLFRDISSCLRALEKENNVGVPNLTSIAALIEKTIDFDLLVELSKGQDYDLKEAPIIPSIQAYLVDDKERLALVFELEYPLECCRAGDLNVRLKPSLKVRGDCFYNSKTDEILETRVTQLEFTYATAWGSRCSSIGGTGYPQTDALPSWTKAIHPTLRMTFKDSRPRPDPRERAVGQVAGD